VAARSKPLVQAVLSGAGAATHYTVPTGHVAIVKHAAALNISGANRDMTIYVHTNAGLDVALCTKAASPADYLLLAPTWFVLDEGDSLGWYTSGGSVNAYASGAELLK
jgi:hypothetical protein